MVNVYMYIKTYTFQTVFHKVIEENCKNSWVEIKLFLFSLAKQQLPAGEQRDHCRQTTRGYDRLAAGVLPRQHDQIIQRGHFGLERRVHRQLQHLRRLRLGRLLLVRHVLDLPVQLLNVLNEGLVVVLETQQKLGVAQRLGVLAKALVGLCWNIE